jgi:hypothetical protein
MLRDIKKQNKDSWKPQNFYNFDFLLSLLQLIISKAHDKKLS